MGFPGKIVQYPDFDKFPRLRSLHGCVSCELNPGDALLIPSTWLHEISTVEDSVSLQFRFACPELLAEAKEKLLKARKNGCLDEILAEAVDDPALMDVVIDQVCVPARLEAAYNPENQLGPKDIFALHAKAEAFMASR